jgi:hypothetical protein
MNQSLLTIALLFLAVSVTVLDAAPQKAHLDGMACNADGETQCVAWKRTFYLYCSGGSFQERKCVSGTCNSGANNGGCY